MPSKAKANVTPKRKPAPKLSATPKPTLSEAAEKSAVKALFIKMNEGGELTVSEAKQVERFQAKQRERTFREYAAALSRKDLQELFAVSNQELSAWEAKGVPRNQDQTFDLCSIIVWMKENREAGGVGEQIAEEDLRTAVAKRKRAELELAKLQARCGGLVNEI